MNHRIDCPACGCPDQHIGALCGFCGSTVPVPADAVDADGTLAVDEIIGWRGWVVGSDGLLRSPTFTHTWTPGLWERAECQQGPGQLEAGSPGRHHADNPDRRYHPPVKGCGHPHHGCGFYAGRTHAHLIGIGYSRFGVIGQVQLAGKVIPAVNGWRAERAQVRAIYVPYESWKLVNPLRDTYGPHGVTVELATTQILSPDVDGGIIEWCQKCGARMQRTSTECPTCGHIHT